MTWIMRRWDRRGVHRSSFSITLAFILSAFVIIVTAQSDPGRVPVYPQNQTVLNGTSVTFACSIPGAESVAWMDEKSTPVVADGQRVSVSVSGLTIDPVDYRQDQHGFYCVGVFNGERNVTTKSPIAYLNVHYMEYNFQQDLPRIVDVYVGDDSVFTCLPPEANPPVSEWAWLKGISSRTRLQSVSGKFTVNNSQLTVHNATFEDSDFYSCTAGNGDFNRTSMDSHLTVRTRPFVDAMVTLIGVDPVPAQLFAVVGSNYTVECKPSVNAEPQRAIDVAEFVIVWRRGGRMVANNDKTEVFPNGSLAIYNFDSTLVGDYRCTITLKYLEQEPVEEDAVVKVEQATIGEDIAINPSTVTRGRDNSVNFTCQLPSSKPQPSVRWMKNSTTTIVNSSHFEILLFEDSSNLVISVLELEDAGTYTCEVMNIAGTRSATVSLTVQDFPEVTVDEEVAYVKEGRNHSLSCQSSSTTASSYRWYFGQKPINLTSSATYSVSSSGQVLQIVNITESEIGAYTCEVTKDSIHVPRNATGNVSFTHELYIKSEPDPKAEAVAGENVSLVCEFRAHYANSDTNRLKLQWFHNNPEVVNSTRYTIYTVSPPGRSELFIPNVSHVDDGNYTCKAMLNGTDEDVNRVIALSVITKAYFTKKPEPTVTVYLGENRSIECVGGGKPQPRIVWRKLGAGELTHSNGLLILDNIKESDAGIYECLVIGDRNTVKTNTTVIVSTKESQANVPTETVIVIGIALVALVFYLLVAILILCACAQCCRARLRMKHKELLQMEAEVRRSSRKSQDVKDNSAILRQTPGFSSSGAIATTSFAIPASPSPSGSRRAMTVVSVDAPTVNSITTPPPSLPTTITEPVQLPNFSRRNLKLGDRLGEGEFGPVLLGTAYGLSPENGPMLVAVKVWMHPRDEDEESADYDLMNFYSQMRLRFDNIASIVGMCTDVEPYYIIYEYLERGDLKQFLQDSRPDEIGTPILTQENLLHIVKQVANGMAYLASQRIIHGDLAARSCIVSTDLRVKVADLGIGHDVYREDYYDNGEQLLPVRWMPPEILQTAEFTLHSDMWSFGVFCWEVFAFGRLPYEDVTDEEVLRLVPQGLRLEVPEEGCPISLYSIMRECWNPHPEARPKFSRLVVAIIDLNLD